MTSSAVLRRTLVDELVRLDALRSPDVRDAFLTVPRERGRAMIEYIHHAHRRVGQTATQSPKRMSRTPSAPTFEVSRAVARWNVDWGRGCSEESG